MNTKPVKNYKESSVLVRFMEKNRAGRPPECGRALTSGGGGPNCRCSGSGNNGNNNSCGKTYKLF